MRLTRDMSGAEGNCSHQRSHHGCARKRRQVVFTAHRWRCYMTFNSITTTCNYYWKNCDFLYQSCAHTASNDITSWGLHRKFCTWIGNTAYWRQRRDVLVGLLVFNASSTLSIKKLNMHVYSSFKRYILPLFSYLCVNTSLSLSPTSHAILHTPQ